mmetsp:Transcript_18631/g.35674  ORF Transcript_18631/g.35674 Transcript_18631/m.35674 type:complete len:234 (+) Transcript_18631:89-790(+)
MSQCVFLFLCHALGTHAHVPAPRAAARHMSHCRWLQMVRNSSTTIHVMACPGARRARRGKMPLYKAPYPSSRQIRKYASTKPLYRREGSTVELVCTISLVLMTSAGQFSSGPTVLATRPVIAACHGDNPSLLFPPESPHTLTLIHEYAVNIEAWLVACLKTVGPAPFHKPWNPSFATILVAQWMGPLYLGVCPIKLASLALVTCACRRVFTTSKGVTTRSASVVPATIPHPRF